MDALLKAKHDDIRKLLADLDDIDDVARASAASFRAEMNGMRQRQEWSVDLASRWITILVQARREHEARLVVAVTPIVDVPQSNYAVQGEDGTWDFYEVKHGQNGRVYVKLWVSDALHSLAWATQQAVLRKIKEMGPLQSAVEYGHRVGECARCHAKLTNPESIERGIGPVCAGRYA